MHEKASVKSSVFIQESKYIRNHFFSQQKFRMKNCDEFDFDEFLLRHDNTKQQTLQHLTMYYYVAYYVNICYTYVCMHVSVFEYRISFLFYREFNCLTPY
jgi:hypothetical protein